MSDPRPAFTRRRATARALGLARIRLHATAEGEPVYAAAGFRPRTDEMELRL
jgi:hypothetical protein